ncbi:hypothetical protein FBU30_009743 [Linnemannia zychae]|nr:hypothetical protein FBU30_009743 [Linnemannia zychae]
MVYKAKNEIQKNNAGGHCFVEKLGLYGIGLRKSSTFYVKVTVFSDHGFVQEPELT